MNNTDIDLYGIVGIRLNNATDGDVKAVKRQLGFEPTSISYNPDIIIHFKEELATPDLTYLGLNYAGFTNNSFYLMNGDDEKKIKIPFEKIGDKIEIECESGINFIPLLSYLINFAFLKKDYLPVHSSGLYYNEKGFLVMGWTKGGKTETLLTYANNGAEYVGDEWVILSSDGKEMFGLPIPVCIWEWQFSQIPDLMPKPEFKKRIVFAVTHFLDSIYKIAIKLNMKKMALTKVLEQSLPIFRQQLNVRVLPDKIFKGRVRKQKTSLDILLLAFSHNDEKIVVEECNSKFISDRMISSNENELFHFFEYYNAFRYAFPDRRNEFLENISLKQEKLLHQILKGKKSYTVKHPYPVSFEKLFNEIEAVINN